MKAKTLLFHQNGEPGIAKSASNTVPLHKTRSNESHQDVWPKFIWIQKWCKENQSVHFTNAAMDK